MVCSDEPPAGATIQLLEKGLALHLAGSLSEAAACYQKVLENEPNQPDALNLLGAVALTCGQPRQAIELCRRAVQIDPKHPSALCNLGNAQFAAGQFSSAAVAYERAIELQPANSETLYNLANARRHLGDPEGALTCFDRALAIDPTNTRAWLNRAAVLSSMERFDEATSSAREAAIIRPHDEAILNHLGLALAKEGKNGEAEQTLRNALRTNPTSAQTLTNLATLLIQEGRNAEAKSMLERVVALDPANALGWSNLAIALSAIDLRVAVEAALKAAELQPNSADAWVLLGNLESAKGEFKKSMVAYDRALALDPNCLENNNNLAFACSGAGRLDQAIDCYLQRLSKDPHDATALADLAIAYLNSGLLEGAIDSLQKSIKADPTNEYAHSNLLLVQTYSPDYLAERQLLEAKAWAAVHTPAVPVRARLGARPRGKKLRVGYLSADFHQHPAGRLYQAMFPHHDRSRFELNLYANQLVADQVTQEIVRSVDKWRIVKKMDDPTLAKTIRDDGIDILVDLLGHTPNHRLKAFALQPAPVQVTWLGYFGTTGMSQMDYILADQWVLPPEFEPHFTERPARMEGCLYTFQPPSLNIGCGPMPSIRNGFTTFGCFNNTAKITPEVVRLWSQVLLKVPDSKLLLNRWPYESARVRELYLNHFVEAGIDPSRVEFQWTSGQEAYYRSYQEVDIMLDSFPFGAGTTTSEALWMGVPVVSMSTDRFAGRMTESIFNAVGIQEMITRSEEEYVVRACELAGNVRLLQEMRTGLRTQVEASSLCDLAGYTKRLEAAFDWMWTH